MQKFCLNSLTISHKFTLINKKQKLFYNIQIIKKKTSKTMSSSLFSLLDHDNQIKGENGNHAFPDIKAAQLQNRRLKSKFIRPFIRSTNPAKSKDYDAVGYHDDMVDDENKLHQWAITGADRPENLKAKIQMANEELQHHPQTEYKPTFGAPTVVHNVASGDASNILM
jgi:hypothetical protein